MNDTPSSPEAAANPEPSRPEVANHPENSTAPTPAAIAELVAPVIAQALLRSGTRTTEFWLIALVVVAVFAQAFMGLMPGDVAATVGGILGALWVVIRWTLKSALVSRLREIEISSKANGAQGEPSTGCLVIPPHETKPEGSL